MPLSKKRKLQIQREAQAVASQCQTVKETEELKRDYEAIITKLNERLEDRLDTFVSQSIPLLREVYPTRPSGVLSVVKEEAERLRDLSTQIIQVMQPVKDPAYRFLAADCIKDLITICTESVAEQHIKASIRAGIKPN